MILLNVVPMQDEDRLFTLTKVYLLKKDVDKDIVKILFEQITKEYIDLDKPKEAFLVKNIYKEVQNRLEEYIDKVEIFNVNIPVYYESIIDNIVVNSKDYEEYLGVERVTKLVDKYATKELISLNKIEEKKK